MDYLDVTHIALRVPGPLRDAEYFYTSLFDLQVSWREPVAEGIPFDASWDVLDRGGVVPEIVMLHRGALRVSIIPDDPTTQMQGPIEHVGVQVAGATLNEVRDRVRKLGISPVAEREGELLDFIDPYGVEWEFDTRSFENPRAILEQKLNRQREAQTDR